MGFNRPKFQDKIRVRITIIGQYWMIGFPQNVGNCAYAMKNPALCGGNYE